MTRSGKVLLAIITLVVAAAVIIVVARRFRSKTYEKGSRKWARQHRDEIVAEALKAVKAGRQLSPAELITESRHFVRTNCDYLFPRDKDAHASGYVLWRMLQTHRTGAKKMRLSCGPMAKALKLLLEQPGIRSRLVQTYSSTPQHLGGHRYLEVLSPETGKWEVQDPTFNLTYRRDGRPILTEEMVFSDLSKVEAVRPHSFAGVDAEKVAELLRDYFHAVLYYDTERSKPALMVINPERFDLAKKFPKNDNLDFPAYIRRKYPGIRVLHGPSKPAERPGG